MGGDALRLGRSPSRGCDKGIGTKVSRLVTMECVSDEDSKGLPDPSRPDLAAGRPAAEPHPCADQTTRLSALQGCVSAEKDITATDGLAV